MKLKFCNIAGRALIPDLLHDILEGRHNAWCLYDIHYFLHKGMFQWCFTFFFDHFFSEYYLPLSSLNHCIANFELSCMEAKDTIEATSVTIMTSTCIITNISDIIKCVGVPHVSFFKSIFLSCVIIIHRVLKSLHWCQEWDGRQYRPSIA